MKPRFPNRQVRKGSIALMGLWLALAARAEPTNGPLVALGFTNTPIGEATTLEVIEGGVLFVGQTVDGSGVSVQLGEADSGVFLFPLTGDLYEGYALEGKAYGSLGGSTNQFISSVYGVHVGGSTVEVTADFSALGATRLSVFAGSRLLGQVSNATASVRVQGPGYGCRANPWWRLPDGSYGALIELDGVGSWYTPFSAPLTEQEAEEGIASTSIFIRPDDPTNSVEFISRVDVISTRFGSFCLTDAILGMFHQRHKRLGEATLVPASGQLTVGNLLTNFQDGIYVELGDASAFDADFLPIDLSRTNASLLVTGSTPSTAWITNSNGSIQIIIQGPSQGTEVIVRSNGVVAGSATVATNIVTVNLSGNPGITGCAVLAKTMETLPGIVVRVDPPTTFTLPGGESFVGDEVRMLGSEPVYFGSVGSVVFLANEIPSFAITGERVSVGPPPPQLNISRASEGVTLWWPDLNRAYWLESAATLSDGFLSVSNEPAFANGECRVTLTTEGNKFFRLRRQLPSDD